MKVGDYVWFNGRDDMFCGTSFEGCGDYKIAGKIMKRKRKSNRIFWVTMLSLKKRSRMPLWAIDRSDLVVMSEEEAMLVILENN